MTFNGWSRVKHMWIYVVKYHKEDKVQQCPSSDSFYQFLLLSIIADNLENRYAGKISAKKKKNPQNL